MRTIRGVTCDTFRDACEIYGTVGIDQSIDDRLTSTSLWAMPASLRRLFAIIMVFAESSNMRALWDKHYASLAKDFSHKINPKKAEQMVLNHIDSIFSAMGKDIRKFWLPEFVVICRDTCILNNSIILTCKIRQSNMFLFF